MIDEILKHQICDKIESIALWYFASLNRTVGHPIFEREQEKEYDCKIEFDAFMKHRDCDNNHYKSFVCVMKCLAEEEIDNLDFVLSPLSQELTMNEISGECAVLPFSQLYQQLENIQREVKHIENCCKDERHVFSDIVSFFAFQYINYLIFCFVVVLIFCLLCTCMYLYRNKLCKQLNFKSVCTISII